MQLIVFPSSSTPPSKLRNAHTELHRNHVSRRDEGAQELLNGSVIRVSDISYHSATSAGFRAAIEELWNSSRELQLTIQVSAIGERSRHSQIPSRRALRKERSSAHDARSKVATFQQSSRLVCEVHLLLLCDGRLELHHHDVLNRHFVRRCGRRERSKVRFRAISAGIFSNSSLSASAHSFYVSIPHPRREAEPRCSSIDEYPDNKGKNIFS